ncbi:MAG: lipid-A-disaccharide synthase N-terminal domain-containing protein [Candidatus Saccharimonadales bacterium]
MHIHSLLTSHYLWIGFGFLAQFVFFLRFMVQWYASEKEGKSVVPLSFWYISIVGTVMIILYSYHIRDVVFFVANILSLGIYFRNLSLIKHEPKSVKLELENKD